MSDIGSESESEFEHDFDQEEDREANEAAALMMAARFRGYLPVIVDVETGGFNSATDAMLETRRVAQMPESRRVTSLGWRLKTRVPVNELC